MPSCKDIKFPTFTITWLADGFYDFSSDPEMAASIMGQIGKPLEIRMLSYCGCLMDVCVDVSGKYASLFTDKVSGIIDFGDGHTITIDRPEA